MKKRSIASLLWFIMVLTFLYTGLRPVYADAAPNYSTVRVRLSNANDGTLNITLNGLYSIASTGKQISGAVQIRSNSGKLQIIDKKTNVQLYNGGGFRILRAADQKGKSGLIRMYNAVHGWRNYLGDLDISLTKDGKFYVVNYLPIEHYLYGVVAYEMSNGFPLEALKAQAVAARGYVAGRIGSYSQFDLGDTPSDQVYKGFDPANKKVIQAVNETKGRILTYKGRVILPYYGASNGGQTELTSNVWSNDMAYCVMKDDPYDLKNPSSMSQKIFFPETVSDETPINSKLAAYLKTVAAPEIKKKGYSTFADQIEILGVTDLKATNSKYDSPSRSYTKAKATLRLRVMKSGSSREGIEVTGTQKGTQPEKPVFKPTGTNSATGGPLYVDQNGRTCDADTMAWYLEIYEAELAEWKEGNVSLSESGSGMSGQTEEISVSVTFTIYDLKDKAKGYRLFNNDNLRMYWSEKTKNGYNLVNVRFGHGVGMSQRGAQQMANEGLTYEDILDFYFEPCELETFSYKTPGLNEISSTAIEETKGLASEADALADENETAPDALDRPEDVESTPGVEGVTSGKVNIYDHTEAKTASATLPANTTVNVLAQNDDWILVCSKTGTIGITKVEGILVENVQGRMRKATNILSEASGGSTLGAVKKNAEVVIYERLDKHYHIATNDGWEGYVPVSSVQIVVDEPVAYLDKAKRYGEAKKTAAVYTAKDKTKKAYTVPGGGVFVVSAKTAAGDMYSIVYNGRKGYIAAADMQLLAKNTNHPNPKLMIANYFPPQEKVGAQAADAISESLHVEQMDKLEKDVQILREFSDVAVDSQTDESASATASLQEPEKEDKRKLYLADPKESMPEKGEKEAYAAVAVHGKIVGQTVNLRQTASTGSKIIRQLENGSEVTVLGQSGEFFKIRDSRGNEGYVATSFVDVEMERTGLISADGVNLRSQATSGSSIVEQLRKGDTVEVLGSSGSYFQVKTRAGNTGYISDQYCKLGAATIPTISGGTASAGTAKTTTTNNKKAVASGTISKDVNFRKAASTNAEIIEKIPGGTRVNIISKRNNFYRISYNGNTGYVAMSFIPTSTLKKPVSGNGTTTVSSSNSNSNKKAVVRTSVNVRTEAGTKIGALEKNDIVNVLGSLGNRYKISKGDLVGYVEDQYLSVMKD